MSKDQAPLFVVLQDLGDSCYLRCRNCGAEFWSDATGENCEMDAETHCLMHSCDTCGNTVAKFQNVDALAFVDILRELSNTYPKISDLRLERFEALVAELRKRHLGG